MKPRKSVKIDLSSLFGDDDSDDNIVEVSGNDVVSVITYTPPTHLTLSVRDVVCRSCGSKHREQLGIFTEFHRGDTMRLERLPADAELEKYDYLPRRVDYAPPASVPACDLCWWTEALVRAAQGSAPTENLLPPNLPPNLEI